MRSSEPGHLAVLGCCERTITVTRTVLKRQFAQNKPYPTNPTSLGDYLRKQRLDQRLTQPEVAVKLKASLATIVKWESNKTTPPSLYRSRIVDFLGFDAFAKKQNPTVE